ncbi:MAG: phosphoribosyltransferase [Chloroflexi bacterium]|nr:phosphoribosyltransferase [Chloroflexota bacterium]
MLFEDRYDAGKKLAQALEIYRGKNAIVLALPRGGVVIGYEVAMRLDLPLDVIITRKVGAPGNPEYAIGAVAETGDVQLNQEEIRLYGISQQYIDEEIRKQREEIERRVQLYRGGRRLPSVRDRIAIIVDDGIATGFTIRASILAIKAEQPKKVVVGVPVAPPDVLEQIRDEADEVICLETPEPFFAVGAWYRHFEQTSDEEVRNFLARARMKRLRH